MGIFDDMNKQLNSIIRGNEGAIRKTDQRNTRLLKKISRDNEKFLKKIINRKVTTSIKEEKRKPIPAKLRKEVYEKYKGRCAKCPKKSPLDIHHKDMKNTNNKPSNLVLLCKNHHGEEHEKYYKKVYSKKWHKKNTLKKAMPEKRTTINKTKKVSNPFGFNFGI